MKPIPAITFIDQIIRNNYITFVTVNEDISTKPYPVYNFSGGEIAHSILSKLHFSHINFENFVFKNCKIKELILDEIRFSTLTISNCQIEKLSILKGFKAATLTIEGNNQITAVIIESAEISKVEILQNSIDEIIIGENTINHIKIEGNADRKLGKVTIKGKNHNVSVNDTVFKDLIFAIASPSNSVTLTKCRVENDLIVEKPIPLISLNSCFVANTIVKAYSTLHLKGGFFNSMKFFGRFDTISMRRDDSGNDCFIGILDLCNTGGNLSLHNSKIESLLMNNFSAATVSFKFLVVKNELRIESATFEGTKFHNVNFSDTEIRLLNTSLAKSELINVEWPKGHQLYEYSRDISGKTLREKLNTLWPLKECYRQLKVLSIDQHNKIDAVAFQKHEIKVYWKIVNLKTWSPFQIKELGNWLILCTNWLFSDFGQSIGRPLVWLLVVHSFLVYRLLATHPLEVELQLNPSLWDWKATNEGFGMFLNLLSPVHDAEIQNDFMKKPESIYGTIDFFMRIASGYFLYYFIRATRKFNYSI